VSDIGFQWPSFVEELFRVLTILEKNTRSFADGDKNKNGKVHEIELTYQRVFPRAERFSLARPE
jgi:hypothetical protein